MRFSLDIDAWFSQIDHVNGYRLRRETTLSSQPFFFNADA
jgi:hypothetical protein